MRRILLKVWQGKLSPSQALNKIQDEAIDNERKFKKIGQNEEWLLRELEALREKTVTVTECEEAIRWILSNGDRAKLK